METTPLGKAEWLVPFGELTDRREEAAALFTDIETRYDSLRMRATAFAERPSVMLNAPYRDVWFVPGDRSYMVRLIEDAGGRYIFAGEESSVSRPISGEAAYLAARQADVWLNPNQAGNIGELKTQNPKFTDIRCVEQRRVYNCTRRKTPGGGSDFWESGSAARRPRTAGYHPLPAPRSGRTGRRGHVLLRTARIVPSRRPGGPRRPCQDRTNSEATTLTEPHGH